MSRMKTPIKKRRLAGRLFQSINRSCWSIHSAQPIETANDLLIVAGDSLVHQEVDLDPTILRTPRSRIV